MLCESGSYCQVLTLDLSGQVVSKLCVCLCVDVCLCVCVCVFMCMCACVGAFARTGAHV